jgi:hypothetical protein
VLQMLTASRRIASALVLSLAGTLLAGCATAQPRPKVNALPGQPPTSILFIGNSFFYYNNSMHGHLLRIANADQPKAVPNLRATSVTISGSGLNWHNVEAYFDPTGMASYSFNADNSVSFNKFDRIFDAAIMMDCSQCPVHPTLKPLFHEYAKKHSDTVRKHGAQPVLFMSWAYQDKPEMTAQLAEAYTIAGNDNDALVIPAGLAFAASVAKRPDINLYVPDKRHPSLAGTYLAAATVYATLFNRSPVGNSYTAGLDPEVARHLQTVAWETVQRYHGR